MARSAHFRAGVVMVVRRDDGAVLAFERADLPGQWQLPQGGIEASEAPAEAAWRELIEETGLGPDDVELVGEHDMWTVYEWPAAARADSTHGTAGRLGQAHRWFFFRPRMATLRPTPDGREFRAWRWVEPAWLVDQVVEFRRAGYAAVLTPGVLGDVCDGGRS